MIVLPLSQGCIAVIDDCDEWQAQYKWHLARRDTCLYATRMQGRRPIYLHQEIMGKAPEGLIIDHKNGRGLDCTRGNMRWVTRLENQRNTKHPRTNTSGFKGVSKKGTKWRAYINLHNRQQNLGSFPTKELAHEARLQAERSLFGVQPRRKAMFDASQEAQ